MRGDEDGEPMLRRRRVAKTNAGRLAAFGRDPSPASTNDDVRKPPDGDNHPGEYLRMDLDHCACYRAIELGALDEGSVDALAGRLGLGERQFRRLCRQHFGASPIAVAQTRRVLLAKQLIHETFLPMTEITFAAGFGSIRISAHLARDPVLAPLVATRAVRPSLPSRPPRISIRPALSMAASLLLCLIPAWASRSTRRWMKVLVNRHLSSRFRSYER